MADFCNLATIKPKPFSVFIGHRNLQHNGAEYVPHSTLKYKVYLFPVQIKMLYFTFAACTWSIGIGGTEKLSFGRGLWKRNGRRSLEGCSVFAGLGCHCNTNPQCRNQTRITARIWRSCVGNGRAAHFYLVINMQVYIYTASSSIMQILLSWTELGLDMPPEVQVDFGLKVLLLNFCSILKWCRKF